MMNKWNTRPQSAWELHEYLLKIDRLKFQKKLVKIFRKHVKDNRIDVFVNYYNANLWLSSQTESEALQILKQIQKELER